jgi:methionine-rich copper-binding protein CopC
LQASFSRTLTLVLALLIQALTVIEADAHAMLDHAEPRVGNKVASPPREVTLYFTQKLEPAFSTITVTGPSGQRVDAGRTRVNGSQISVPLKGDGAGTYHVNWRVLSVDTHTTNGSFTFQVGP